MRTNGACARVETNLRGDQSFLTVSTKPRSEWTVAGGEAGVRLDKYVAAPERLGSRRRVSVALERGQIFVNGKEATLADAGSRLTPNDVVRLWMDRPGSATRRAFRPI